VKLLAINSEGLGWPIVGRAAVEDQSGANEVECSVANSGPQEPFELTSCAKRGNLHILFFPRNRHRECREVFLARRDQDDGLR
jgi:hypothetical protein